METENTWFTDSADVPASCESSKLNAWNVKTKVGLNYNSGLDRLVKGKKVCNKQRGLNIYSILLPSNTYLNGSFSFQGIQINTRTLQIVCEVAPFHTIGKGLWEKHPEQAALVFCTVTF